MRASSLPSLLSIGNLLRAATLLIVLALAVGCVSHTERDARALQAAPWLSPPANESLIVVTVRNPRVVDLRAGSTVRDYDAGQAYGPSPRARSEMRKLGVRRATELVKFAVTRGWVDLNSVM